MMCYTLNLSSLNSAFTSRPLSLASSSPHPLFDSLCSWLDFKGSWLMYSSVLSAWDCCCLAENLQPLIVHSSLGDVDTAALSVALRHFLGKAHTKPIFFPICSCLSFHGTFLSSYPLPLFLLF